MSEIVDKLEIIKKRNLPAGSFLKGPSIKDCSIFGLFPFFKEVGINISHEISEKRVSYSIPGVTRDSYLLLRMDHKDYGDINQYILRDENIQKSNKGLIIFLEDYDNSLDIQKRNEQDNRLGGTMNYESGIICDIFYKGDDLVSGARDIEKTKQVLSDFYKIKKDFNNVLNL